MNIKLFSSLKDNGFTTATTAEITTVAGIETAIAVYPFTDCPEAFETTTDALLHGLIDGIETTIKALKVLAKEHPHGDSLGAGFINEILQQGLNRGLEHHGITITEQKEEEKEEGE